MNVRIIRTTVALVALILVGAAWAQAEPTSVQIKFKFIVAGKILEAGNYTVDAAASGKVVLTPESGTAIELPQLKSYGRKVAKLELVFDEVGGTMYLTEAWLPGKDGVKVGNADGSVARRTVTAKK